MIRVIHLIVCVELDCRILPAACLMAEGTLLHMLCPWRGWFVTSWVRGMILLDSSISNDDISLTSEIANLLLSAILCIQKIFSAT